MITFDGQRLEDNWIFEQFVWRVDTKEVYNKETCELPQTVKVCGFC